MKTTELYYQDFTAAVDDVEKLESALQAVGKEVPQRPKGMERLSASDFVCKTLDMMSVMIASAETHAATLRLQVRGIGIVKPSATPANATAMQSPKALSLRDEIHRLEALEPVSKGHTLKCIQANLASKRAELAREGGK